MTKILRDDHASSFIRLLCKGLLLRPYYRWKTKTLLRQFASEIQTARTRYARCWARLTQDRIILDPEMGLCKIENSYDGAQWQIQELRRQMNLAAERFWFEAFSEFNWEDVMNMVRSSQAEWFHAVAQCGLELAQDFGVDYVRDNLSGFPSEVLLDEIKGCRVPAPRVATGLLPVRVTVL